MGIKINYDGLSSNMGSPYVIATGKNITVQKLYEFLRKEDMNLFGVLIDTTKDEYEELTEVDVFYADELLSVIGEYVGYDRAIRILEESKP